MSNVLYNNITRSFDNDQEVIDWIVEYVKAGPITINENKYSGKHAAIDALTHIRVVWKGNSYEFANNENAATFLRDFVKEGPVQLISTHPNKKSALESLAQSVQSGAKSAQDGAKSARSQDDMPGLEMYRERKVHTVKYKRERVPVESVVDIADVSSEINDKYPFTVVQFGVAHKLTEDEWDTTFKKRFLLNAFMDKMPDKETVDAWIRGQKIDMVRFKDSLSDLGRSVSMNRHFTVPSQDSVLERGVRYIVPLRDFRMFGRNPEPYNYSQSDFMDFVYNGYSFRSPSRGRTPGDTIIEINSDNHRIHTLDTKVKLIQ